MQKSAPFRSTVRQPHARRKPRSPNRILPAVAVLSLVCASQPAGPLSAAPVTDPVLNLMLEKGMITTDEAAKVQGEKDDLSSNQPPLEATSPWKMGTAFKGMEIYGDARLRYEDRSATDPKGGTIDLNRYRYALRIGLRGDLYDDFYYGVRVDTSPTPRSSWVTFGTASSSGQYQGPFGKSTAGIYVNQIFLGWRPEDWLNISLGKMSNPLFTTAMVWSPTLNPEGAAETFKHTIGAADVFATFGQFIYQDTNPTESPVGYFNPVSTYSSQIPFVFAWQGGLTYHITKKVSLTVAPAVYNYSSFQDGTAPAQNSISPDFYGTFVGQGTPSGLNNAAASYNLAPTGSGFDGFAANQTGINNLLVLEFPVELNVELGKYHLQFFGDYAQNLEGEQRAQAAYGAANSSYFSTAGAGYAIDTISSPQTHDVHAYQAGVSFASKDGLGIVNGFTAKKHAWEVRTY